MIKLWVAYLPLAELFVSSIVHLLYGFYIFSLAVAGDLSQALNDLCFKTNVNTDVSEGTVANVDNLPPIVLVRGIFGFGKVRLGGLSYFAGAKKKDERVLVPNLGSLTSGQVDYGEEHNKACGHSQFGRVYEQGHYPEWDEDHPVHFAFKGFENTNENWVLSITSVSGAFNGTTRTYLDGMQPEDEGSMKTVCLLQLLRHIVSVVLYFVKFFFLHDLLCLVIVSPQFLLEHELGCLKLQLSCDDAPSISPYPIKSSCFGLQIGYCVCCSSYREHELNNPS
ncbi:hypothetical protein UlMin_005112 [Ulmus minor]